MDVWHSMGLVFRATVAVLAFNTIAALFVHPQPTIAVATEPETANEQPSGSNQAGSISDEAANTPQFAMQLDSLFKDEILALRNSRIEPGLLVRRLYLDLIGTPPTLDELNSYLSDTSADRYQRLVDALISRHEFVEHWAERFDVMLMERRPNTHVAQDIWSQWLRDQIAADRPLNDWMADLITADGYPAESRAPARFLLDRGGDPHLITRDVGRIYFGRDLQCAQCHDHPAIDSYLQSDYHGILGFVATLGMIEVTEGETKLQVVSEKSAGEAPFESVFARGKFRRVLPTTPLSDEIEFAPSIPGQDYVPSTKAGYPAKPLASRRQQLANLIRSGKLEAFNENLANRIFAFIFGRGIVSPVDLIHAENPPLHPDALRKCATFLVETNFRLKPLVRELVLSSTYQLGPAPITYAGAASQDVESIGTDAPSWLFEIAEKARNDVAQLELQISQASKLVESADQAHLAAIAQFEPVEAERITALAAVDAANATLIQANEAHNKAVAEKTAADAALSAAKERLSKLEIARDAVIAAQAAVPQDADLQSFVTSLTTKCSESSSAIAQLAAEQTNKEQLLATAAAKVSQDVQALTSSIQAATAVNERHKVSRKTLLDARVELESAKTERTRIGSRKRALTRVIELVELYQSIDTNRKQYVEQQQRLDQLSSLMSEYVASLDGKQIELGTLVTAEESAKQRVREIEAQAAAMNMKTMDLKLANEQLAKITTVVSNVEKIQHAISEIASSINQCEQQNAQLDSLVTEAKKAKDMAGLALQSGQQALFELQSKIAATESELNASRTALQGIEQAFEDLEKQRVSQLRDFEHMLGDRLLSARLIPLTPEQMCWSILTVTGLMQRFTEKCTADLEKETPATEEQKSDSAWLAARKVQAIRRARAELQGNTNHFITLYGAGPGQPQSDFFATADQALYASNGGAVFSWAAPAGNNITERIIATSDNVEAAKILYLGILSRQPTQDEMSAVNQYLNADPAQRSRLAQELVWGLIAGVEFRFAR